ncbi:MAG TPA: DNA polymerase III subunit chi [Burkholderiales bacterium]|nr:DNA polymerase III subunit chi [Burkholderiales bacterium]
MTQVDFYTHVEDRLRTACVLAGKAYASGMRVLVFCADHAAAQKFSHLLWSAPSTGFVPHCMATDALAGITPVIVDHEGTNIPHDEVLINLRDEWPPFFSRFQRLLEIVSLDEAEREAARQRFRFYRDRGYEIRSHDRSRAGARP